MENHVDFLGLIYCCSPSYQGKGTMMRPLVTSTLGYRDIRVKGKEWPAVGFKNIADAA